MSLFERLGGGGGYSLVVAATSNFEELQFTFALAGITSKLLHSYFTYYESQGSCIDIKKVIFLESHENCSVYIS